jgi:hypothetical protein
MHGTSGFIPPRSLKRAGYSQRSLVDYFQVSKQVTTLYKLSYATIKIIRRSHLYLIILHHTRFGSWVIHYIIICTSESL